MTTAAGHDPAHTLASSPLRTNPPPNTTAHPHPHPPDPLGSSPSRAMPPTASSTERWLWLATMTSAPRSATARSMAATLLS